MSAPIATAPSKQHHALAASLVRRFDKDRDGMLDKAELGLATDAWVRLDASANGLVTGGELAQRLPSVDADRLGRLARAEQRAKVSKRARWVATAATLPTGLAALLAAASLPAPTGTGAFLAAAGIGLLVCVTALVVAKCFDVEPRRLGDLQDEVLRLAARRPDAG